MTQRRKIALSYAFAVPIVLAIALFQHWAFFGVNSTEIRIAEEAGALQDCGAIISSLKQAETQAKKYAASNNSDDANLNQIAVSQLKAALQELGELTKSEPSTQSKLQTLRPLVSKWIGLLQTAMVDRKEEGVVQNGDPEGQRLRDAIEGTIADIQSFQQVRLQQEKESAARSLHLASAFTTYGGAVTIWLVGVAAFLLFHDEKARAWTGVERRVHTKILETLPFGVSLTTDSGIILYANPAEEALFGYPHGELVGRNAILLHGTDGEDAERTISEIFARLDSTRSWSGEFSICKRNGTPGKVSSWIMNLQVADKLFRLFLHNA